MNGQAPEFLDIKQAAALLQVSEASLRRWTDAGKLASFRVGGRRERRFRRADLIEFLESHPVARPHTRPAGPPPNLSASHVCGLYASDLARLGQAVGFLADRDASGSVCFLVMSPEVRERVLPLLERHRPSLRADIEAGRFVVSEYAELAGPQLAFWAAQFGAAVRAGARSLRVVGDVSGGALGQRHGFEEVLEYEAEFDRSISRRFPVATLCQYDARTLSGVETARVVHAHGAVFRQPVEDIGH